MVGKTNKTKLEDDFAKAQKKGFKRWIETVQIPNKRLGYNTKQPLFLYVPYPAIDYSKWPTMEEFWPEELTDEQYEQIVRVERNEIVK